MSTDTVHIVLVLDGTAHGANGRRNMLNREGLTLRRYQTCRRQATSETRKEGL